MRKGWIFIICLLMFALTGCNYDLDSSKQIQAVSPDEYVKTVANEFFSSENLDTLEIQKISQTISYLSKSYASYPSSVTGKPSIYLLIKDVQQIIGGDINVLPTLLNGFKNETGVYEANRDSGKWIRTAVATDSIVMHFKDQYNQDREGIMSWYYSYGQPMQLTLVRKSGTVKVEVPDRIMVKLRNLSSENDSALTINFRMIPDQTFSKVNFITSATFLSYSLTSTAEVKDTAMHIKATLTKGEREIASYHLDGDGSYMLTGFIDKVDYTSALGSYVSSLNILNKLYTTNDVKDANTIKNYLLSNTSLGTYDYVKGICDVVNNNMYFRVWNSSGALLCTATMYPVKMNGEYTGAPYVNWIYGDSQDLSDFSSDGIKNTVSRLQQALKYISNLLGQNS